MLKMKKNQMNKIIPVFAALAILAASCTDEEKAKVTVEPTSAVMEYTGGTAALVVTSNAPWTAECEYEEVQINPSSGNGDASVVIVVPQSTYKESKAVRVTFKAQRDTSYTSTAKFIITLPAKPFVELSTESAFVSPDGGGIRFSLTANKAWKAVSDNAISGLTVAPAEGDANADVTISIPENNTGASRSSKVTFALDEDPAVKTVFTVSQNPK